jgi:hypothetical protein
MAENGYERLPAAALNQFRFPPGSGHALLAGVNSCFRPFSELGGC